MAGVVIGPFTPGYDADGKLATELAEIGVILLMFDVGLHFSLKDLLAVKTTAVPGALGQIAVATAMGVGLVMVLGWPLGAGLIFGLALSVASTVVLLRALQDRRLVETDRGRIAVGWLIVEDLVMVLTLVLIPPLAGLLGGTAVATPTGGRGCSCATASWPPSGPGSPRATSSRPHAPRAPAPSPSCACTCWATCWGPSSSTPPA